MYIYQDGPIRPIALGISHSNHYPVRSSRERTGFRGERLQRRIHYAIRSCRWLPMVTGIHLDGDLFDRHQMAVRNTGDRYTPPCRN